MLAKAYSSNCRGLFWCPFSLVYAVASYVCCCSCCSSSTIIEKEEEIAATQEHKKPTSKRNPRNLKPKRRETKKNLPLSILSDKEQFL
jgi:hypothetical protein